MPMPNDITSIDAILEPTKGVIKHVKDLISQLDPKQLLDGEVSFAAEDVKSAYRIWLSSLVAKLSLSSDVTFTDKKQLHDQGKEIVDRAGSFVRSFERAGLIPPGQITRSVFDK